jgi:dGTPase
MGKKPYLGPQTGKSMQWEQLLSLRRQGDTRPRLRKEQDESRLGFEVDYDRVIFSSAFRSLQDKTQVIPLSKTDFVHTRLTHSLEVSVVGRSLGRIVGQQLLEKYPGLREEHGYQFNDFGAIVAAAALAHDIGNPPFGHSGEKAIGEFFSTGNGQQYRELLTAAEYQDLIDFEGNANGFRLLTASREGVPGGLRLSYATLGAFTKYPKESLPKKPSKHIADKKFGFFQSEKQFFSEVAEELDLDSRRKGETLAYARHPLTYLVEAADDICYTIIDFEDGINLGLISEDYALEYFINLVKDRIDTSKYHAMPIKADRLSYLRALAINTLINDAATTFMLNERQILEGVFDVSLMDQSQYKAQIRDIIQLSDKKIYRSQEVLEKEIAGFKILADLLEVYTGALVRESGGNALNYDRLLINTLPHAYQETAGSVYDILLNTSCYIASLSDGAAVHIHNKITGKLL